MVFNNVKCASVVSMTSTLHVKEDPSSEVKILEPTVDISIVGNEVAIL